MKENSSTELQKVFKEIVLTLVSVVEYKDPFFRGHSERVAANCVRFSNHLSMPREFIESIYLAGLVYDIGMVYVPMEIIHKPDKLTPEEMELIREHPKITEKILSNLRFFKNILPMIRHHHESFNGEGYPDGLKGEKIPIGARILSVADSFDAMTSERPHRPALSNEEALKQLNARAGQTFDPELVTKFVHFMTPEEKTVRNEGNSAVIENKTIQKAVSDVVMAFKKGLIEFPAFPSVIQKIQDALKSADKTIDDIAGIIELDQVVTLRLLSVANSSHFGGGGKTHSVAQALSRIGLKDAEGIVSFIAMKSIYAADNAAVIILMEKFWRHAIATAHVTRALVKRLNETDGEMIFLLGLTHDIGKVLLLNALAKILFKKGETNPINMEDVLASIQNVHANFGGALLKKWGFNENVIMAVSTHENPALTENTPKMILILFLANMITRRIGSSMFEDQPAGVADAIKLLGLGEAEIDAMLEGIKEAVEKSISSI